MQAVVVTRDRNVRATASARCTQRIGVRKSKIFFFMARKLSCKLCSTSTRKLQFKMIGVEKHWRRVVLVQDVTHLVLLTERTSPLALGLHMQKFLLHNQSLPSRHFFFTVSFLERYFSADLVPFLAKAPFRQKTSTHAHQQLPNNLLSSVKCLRKHFPYNQDSWSKWHLGVETQFGPSSVTEAATHARIVQKQANTTHSLSSYHYSCQKN